MMNKLSQKQLDYCHNLVFVTGTTQQEAYLKSYPDSSILAAQTSSATLMNNPMIIKEIECLRAEKVASLKASQEKEQMSYTPVWSKQDISRLRAELHDDPDTPAAVRAKLLLDSFQADYANGDEGNEGPVIITWGAK